MFKTLMYKLLYWQLELYTNFCERHPKVVVGFHLFCYLNKKSMTFVANSTNKCQKLGTLPILLVLILYMMVEVKIQFVNAIVLLFAWTLTYPLVLPYFSHVRLISKKKSSNMWSLMLCEKLVRS